MSGQAPGGTVSVLRDRGVHLIAPGQDAASQVLDLAETGLFQEVYRFPAALAAAAIGDHFIGRIELVHARGDLSQRNQIRARKRANLDLMRLAHVEQKELVAPVQLVLQLHG